MRSEFVEFCNVTIDLTGSTGGSGASSDGGSGTGSAMRINIPPLLSLGLGLTGLMGLGGSLVVFS